MLAVVDYVSTRPAPGPLTGAGGPHKRNPRDPAFCLCGERWVQAMTCHPCRQPGHAPASCVDGPGLLVNGERVYPARSAGRWCMCGHKLEAAPAEPAATGARFGPGTLTLTTQAGKSATLETTGGRLEFDPEAARPYLTPALAAAARDGVDVDRITRILADARPGTAGAEPGFRAALARQRHLMGLPAIEGLYTLEPPAAVPAGFCGDVPPAAGAAR